MRFCHPFTLITTSRDGEKALARHQRIEAKSLLQCDQPRFIGFPPHANFLRPIARPIPCPRNLTEFPFAHNFSKSDLEGL